MDEGGSNLTSWSLFGFMSNENPPSIKLNFYYFLGTVVALVFIYAILKYGINGKWFYSESIPYFIKATLVIGIGIHLLIAVYSKVEHRIMGIVCGVSSALLLSVLLFK